MSDIEITQETADRVADKVNDLYRSLPPEEQAVLETLIRQAAHEPEVAGHSMGYYFKIRGIEGESTDDKHKSEIDVRSFSFRLVR